MSKYTEEKPSWFPFNPKDTSLQKRWTLLVAQDNYGNKYLICWDIKIEKWVYIHSKVPLGGNKYINTKNLLNHNHINITHYFPLHDLQEL